MKKVLLFAVLFLSFISNSLFAEEGLRVLFIGNSFTFQGPIPEIFQAIAVDAGKAKPEVRLEAVGGKSLGFHSNRKETLQAIDEGNWDFVVLQEYSTNPTDNIGSPEEFKSNAVKLYDRIKTSSPEAKVVMYETWARHEKHDIYKKSFKDRTEMQSQLIKHYRDCAAKYIPTHCKSTDKADVLLAPAGEAWQANYLDRNIMLHADELYHAGDAGKYLNGLVIYATIYKSKVSGLKPQLSVSKEDAEYLQKIVDKLCKSELTKTD